MPYANAEMSRSLCISLTITKSQCPFASMIRLQPQRSHQLRARRRRPLRVRRRHQWLAPPRHLLQHQARHPPPLQPRVLPQTQSRMPLLQAAPMSILISLNLAMVTGSMTNSGIPNVSRSLLLLRLLVVARGLLLSMVSTMLQVELPESLTLEWLPTVTQI